ncbi:zinc ribbon domain-containing protein [Paenibacillus sp. 7516]|uniref:zinc ribbon domain-containing protein n=1 Tax=Paenibacillus sp. 7516 TaxID=2022549 RepID=UPI000BA55CE6|nr:zinc ribbon domain-containing protein [Paenibacillus sp. 7516]PAF28492.1 hypothetical protein CHI14_27515 [Paenibacillus sp. 7516]
MNVTICQSCGMPLTTPTQFGTEADGSATREYCIYCYKEGMFQQPNITMEGMIEMCTAILMEEGMGEESARAMLRNQLPFLKRWSPSNPEGNNNKHSVQPVRYVTLPGKRLAGISARTTNAIEMSGHGCIQDLWSRYFSSGHIPAPEAPRYGCYTDYTDGIHGEYTILVGHEVAADETLPAGMNSVELPPATYAVFTSRKGPMAEVVGEAWGAVWGWSNQNERTFTGDFELYDERSMDPAHVQVDIYIAVNQARPTTEQ